MVLAALMGLLAAAACSGSSNSKTPTPAQPTPRTGALTPDTATAVPLSGDITVFAAASLTDAFKEAGTAFRSANPGATVTFSFAGSSALATQINQGAPADVFASADPAQMKIVADTGVTEAQRIFATNVPVVIVPATGSPVAAFADLAKPGVKLVLASAAVPIGNYARQIFTKASGTGGISADFSAKVLANLQSNETDVKAVLAKIQIGEGDAGVVYTTDAATATGKVKAIAIPDRYNVIAQYPIAVLKNSRHREVADAFEAFILSNAGQAILAKYGFGNPTG